MKKIYNCATANSGTIVDRTVLEHHDSRRPPPCFQNKQLLWSDCAQSTGTAYYCLLCVQDETLPCAHGLGTQQFILMPHADMKLNNVGSLFLFLLIEREKCSWKLIFGCWTNRQKGRFSKVLLHFIPFFDRLVTLGQQICFWYFFLLFLVLLCTPQRVFSHM